MADIKQISINNNTYDICDAKAARKGMYVGTCPSSASVGGSTVTMASSADKVVTVDTFPTDANNKPLVGTIIGVKYATSNTYKTDPDNNKPEAPHRINVNGTGYIQIYYNNAALKSGTSANTLAAGYKNRYIYYQYDGTYWVWLSAGTDTNTTYAGYSFGLGLGVQNNSSASATITVTLSNYALGTGGVTSVRFLYDVPANSTMNINSKGAKSIYYKNSAITAGIIKAGDTATFVYSGQYHLIAIDRWDDDIKAKANSADLATVATSGSYNDLSNKPTIPAAVTVDSSLTGSSQTNPVQGGAIYSALAGKEDKPLVVTFTESNGTYSADKTYAQIGTALSNGLEVVGVFGTDLFTLVRYEEGDAAAFASIQGNFFQCFYVYSSEIEYSFGQLGQFKQYNNTTSLNADEPESGTIGFVFNDGFYIFDGGALEWKKITTSDSLSSYVPTSRKVNNKALSSDITLTASDVGADVFVVYVEFPRSSTSIATEIDKTNAEIYAAWQAGRMVLCRTSGGRIFTLHRYPTTTSATFFGFADMSSTSQQVDRIVISTENNTQTGVCTSINLQELVSGTNIKTINKQSVLGSGDLTPLYAGSIAGKLYRNNVGGTGNFSISGNSGCIPNIPAGTYVVSIFAKSTTTSYTYRFNFGSVTYDLSTTNGVIYDTRTITLSAAGTFSGSVYNTSVASNSILSVVMYNWQMPVTSVGMAAVTNSYQDLNDKPTIPTVNNGTLTIQKNGTTVQTFTANQSSSVTANITVPTTASDVSAMSTSHAANAITSQNITDWSAKADPITVVTNSGTGSVSQAMDAGKFYKFTGAVTALTLTFNSATNLAIYAGKFTSDSSTATTITLPSGYTAASSNPTIETGESYEFSVMDNVFLMVKL